MNVPSQLMVDGRLLRTRKRGKGGIGRCSNWILDKGEGGRKGKREEGAAFTALSPLLNIRVGNRETTMVLPPPVLTYGSDIVGQGCVKRKRGLTRYHATVPDVI